MAKYKLPCEIVQDLLPSYIDGLTSEITTEAMEEHLIFCENCKAVLERMREPDPEEKIWEVKKIDYLKKARAAVMKKVYAVFGVVLLAVVGLVFWKAYMVGENVSHEEVTLEVSVSHNGVSIEGFLHNQTRGISDVLFEEKDGVLNIQLQSTMKSGLHENQFETRYKPEKEIVQVRMGERIFWDHGHQILLKTSEVFCAKHAYMDEFPKNLRLTEALGMEEALGSFTIEHDTAREPYGWNIVWEEEVPEFAEEAWISKMKQYAFVLIATVDNLGYVEFQYITETGMESLYVSEAEASEIVERDIKSFAETPAQLQELMIRKWE